MIELRSIEREDLPQLLVWRNKNRKYFREYRLLNTEDQNHWFESLINNRKIQMFAIIEDKDLLGVCGLTSIDWIAGSAEISIYIGDGYIDKEIAPKTLILLEKYAFADTGLRRLWVEIFDFDECKKQLFAARYTLEVTQRQAHWACGDWFDILTYGFIRD